MERTTRSQAKSEVWHAERKHRLTASKFGKICKMESNTSCKLVVYDFLYSSLPENNAIEYGVTMEPRAKLAFEELYDVEIKPVGLCVDENVPFLAASPG